MRYLLVSALALAAGGAMADDALIIGTDTYDNFDRFRRGTEVADAADAMTDAGFDVIALSDATDEDIDRALRQFAQAVPGAERLVVALSGRFATDGSRTWYMPRDYANPRIDTVGQSALSVETLLLMLAERPGQAVLVLSTDDAATDDFDGWLNQGIGTLDIPQGVTVVRAGPRNVARFLTEDITAADADIAAIAEADSNLVVTGFLPASLPFGGGEVVQEAQAKPELEPVATQTDVEIAAERALWEGAVALDTEAAYANYLQRYPNGTFTAEAQDRRQAILDEPNRDARLAEEALQLSRDDRREIQRALTLLDFNTRGIDGIFGPGSRGALTNWQQQNGFAQTGYITSEQVVRLEAQAARRAAEIEAEAERQRQIEIAADRAFWEETGAAGDEPGLRAYLGRYPDGLYADAASTRLATIEAERARQAEGEERSLWQRAQTADTAPGYQQYLDTYPQGNFVAAAEARIAELTQEEDDAPRRQEAQAVEDALGLNQLTRQLIEARLESLGLEPGAVDGEFDRDTRRAIRRFQRDRGFERTGFLDEQSVVLLLAETLTSP